MKKAMSNGEELRSDIATFFFRDKDPAGFTHKWGKYMFEIIFSNFIMPIGLAEDQRAEAKKIAPKLDLFCAAFI